MLSMQTPQNQFITEIKCKFLNKQEKCKQLIMNFRQFDTFFPQTLFIPR
jgi:hypothetical protein